MDNGWHECAGTRRRPDMVKNSSRGANVRRTNVRCHTRRTCSHEAQALQGGVDLAAWTKPGTAGLTVIIQTVSNHRNHSELVRSTTGLPRGTTTTNSQQPAASFQPSSLQCLILRASPTCPNQALATVSLDAEVCSQPQVHPMPCIV